MSDQFVGEIRMFGGNFAPQGWATCDGQLLPINQNAALFSLLGTYYGGNGSTTFGLPDLRGRFPINWGQGVGLSPYQLGQHNGTETVSLTQSQTPAHTHVATAVTAADTSTAVATPKGNLWAANSAIPTYAPSTSALTPMNPGAVSVAGGSQPHNNLPPFLVVTYIIALQGYFPPRN